MYEKLEHTLQGTLANFLVDYDSSGIESNEAPGHVQLTDESDLLIDTIAPPEDFSSAPAERLPMPYAIPAFTTKTGALFMDFRRVRGNVIWGGSAVSTRSFNARFVAVHVDARDLRSTGLTRLQAHFPGLTRWAGLQSITTSSEKGEDGKPISVTATVRTHNGLHEAAGDGRSIELSIHWDVSGPDDRVVFNAPVSVASRSEEPLEWHEHLDALKAVQDLLNLAYKGFVVAEGGVADFDVAQDVGPSTTPRWWHSQMMTIPKGVDAPKSRNEFPVFSLTDIGGLTGVVRWIELHKSHPRATGPLTARYHLGGMALESQILNMGPAIEYWIAANRGDRQEWATKVNDEPLCSPLVRHVGEPFAEFVSDPVKWADKFWKVYTALKHIPTATYDPYETYLLAESAEVLLECALLNQVAGSDQPAKVICESPRNHSLRENLRNFLGSATP
ncbi:HEPN domain-containing protein [Rhodococcus ruber]|uniref:ApeA N-terminal domain 1-containing protein n=1 Tax=Rhodococcus ruber TaxID=1830 RepID=UPI00265FBE66|nr:HEPN domain-containing protein [Rhodococcus ruber]MDO1481581.1 hypothetical protein [Rhodococcus ruber]